MADVNAANKMTLRCSDSHSPFLRYKWKGNEKENLPRKILSYPKVFCKATRSSSLSLSSPLSKMYKSSWFLSHLFQQSHLIQQISIKFSKIHKIPTGKEPADKCASPIISIFREIHQHIQISAGGFVLLVTKTVNLLPPRVSPHLARSSTKQPARQYWD